MEPNTPEPALGPVSHDPHGTREELMDAVGVGRHPSTRQHLAYFSHAHLADSLRWIVRGFADLAVDLARNLPDGPELTKALGKLVEAKDAAVRHAVDVSTKR
jgi:hypothetical protein